MTWESGHRGIARRRNRNSLGRKAARALALAAAAAAGLLAQHALAGTSTWNGSGSDSYWTDPSNWGGTAPTSGSVLDFSGTKNLGPSNNEAAGFTVGGITFDSMAGSFGLVGSTVILNGAVTDNSSATESIYLNMGLQASENVTVASGGNLRLYGTISGDGSALNVNGPGQVLLRGTNTYFGGTNISSGTVVAYASGALPTGGDVSVAAGAALDLEQFSQSIGALTGGGTIDAAVTPTLTLNGPSNGATCNFSGVMQNTYGTLSVAKNGVYTQILSGANTFSGTTTVNQGTLQLGNANALQNSTLTMTGGGALTFSSGIGTFNVAAISGSCNQLSLIDTNGRPVSLVVGNNNASTIFGAEYLSGSGSLVKVGSGSLRFGAIWNASSTAGISVNGGTLQIDSGGDLGPATASLTLNGGTLATVVVNNFPITALPSLNVGSVGGSINVAATGTMTASGPISGSGNLNINGSGTLNLSGNISGSVGLNVTGSGPVNLSGNFTGSGGLSVSGGDTVTLTGTNSYTGTTTISSGTVMVEGGESGLGNISINNSNATTATLASNYPWTIGLAPGKSFTLSGATSNNLAVINSEYGLKIGTPGNGNTVTFGNNSELVACLGPEYLVVQGVLDTSSPSNILALSGPGLGDCNGRLCVLNYSSGILIGANSAANGGFGSASGVPTGFHLEMTGNATTGGEVDLVQREVIGTITATPQYSRIMAGAVDPVSFTVQNAAMYAGDNLVFTTNNGSNLIGSAGGTVAAATTSNAITGLSFTSSITGRGQTGSFTVNDPNATNSGQTGTVTVDVYDHGLVPNQTINGLHVTQGQSVNFNYALCNPMGGSALRDGATISGVSADGGGFAGGCSGSTTIAAGGSSSAFTGTCKPTYGGPSSYQFNFTYGDQDNYAGFNNNNQTATLTVNGIVDALVEVDADNSAATAAGRPLLNTLDNINGGSGAALGYVNVGGESSPGMAVLFGFAPNGNLSAGLTSLEYDLTAFHYTWRDASGNYSLGNGVAGSGAADSLGEYTLEVDVPNLPSGDPVISFDFSNSSYAGLEVVGIGTGPSSVPEPSAAAMVGLAAAAAVSRRVRRVRKV